MQSMSDIRHRIRASSQTRQITRAMQMISTSRMHRAVAMSRSNAVYVSRVRSAMKDILQHAAGFDHPFIKRDETFKKDPCDAYIVIAGDKGLAGGYNHNVLQLALEHMRQNKQQKYIVSIGQMTRGFFDSKEFDIDEEFLHIAQDPSLHNARLVAHTLIELYKQESIDEILVAHTQMDSTLVQTPRLTRLLPLLYSDFDDVEANWEDPGHNEKEILYAPSPRQVLDVLVPQYVVGRVYGALVQSYASEHLARMNAMATATRNADDMIRKLQQAYNRARQAAITQEIAEIISGASALQDH